MVFKPLPPMWFTVFYILLTFGLPHHVMKHGAMDDPCLACNATERDYETLLNVSRNDTYINKFYFYQTAQVAFLGGLLVAIVAGNSTVLLALLLAKTRKSRMNYFIMQLAIADLWVGLISVLPDLIQRMTISWLAGSAACKAMKFLQGVVTYSSTYVLVALSIDRCDAITHPMNFTGSWRRARALIVSSWCLSFLLCVPMLFLFDEAYVQGTPQCWSGISKLQWRLWISGVFVTLFVLPAVTITACYGIIVATIWHKGRRGREVMRQYSDDLVRTASSRGVIPKAKIKTVKMTFAIVFVFVLCWSPYMVFDLLQVYDYVPYTQANVAVASLIQSLAPLNSAANPVIYFLFSKRIFASLRNIPPYKWLWCGVLTDAKGDARPQTELLTSSHRKTKRDLTVKVLENSFNKSSKRSRGSKTVRMRLPDECEQANNNTRALSHARKSDTYL